MNPPPTWYVVGSLGPHNHFDFPLWLRYPDGREEFWWSKTDMETSSNLWRKAVEWRDARHDSGQYRVLESRGKFIPQQLVKDKWIWLRDVSPQQSLEQAKKIIADELVMLNPPPDKIHPYP